MRRIVSEALAASIFRVEVNKANYQPNFICRAEAQFIYMQHITRISRRFLLNFNRMWVNDMGLRLWPWYVHVKDLILVRGDPLVICTFERRAQCNRCPGIEICKVVIPLANGLCEIRLAKYSMIRCNGLCPIFTCTAVFVLHLNK